MADKYRISAELPDGINRISQTQHRVLKERVARIHILFPAEALVGGTALRLWCESRNMDVPEEIGRNIDVVGSRFRTPEHLTIRRGITLDLLPAKRPMKEPFFTKLDYESLKLKIITPAHLAVAYAAEVVTIPEGNEPKYLGYYQIMKDMLLPGEMEDFIGKVPTYSGGQTQELLEDADSYILPWASGT